MSRFKLPFGIVLGCLLPLFCIVSCKGLPKTAQQPVFPLEFDRIEASEPEKVNLYFTLRAENPRNSGVVFHLSGYRLFINGEETAEKSSLTFPFWQADDVTADDLTDDVKNKESNPRLAPLAQGEFPVLLRLELNEKYDTAELTVNLVMDLGLVFDNKKKSSASAEGTAEFPRIKEPVFSITSIAILQAELINTRLKVRLRVDNPNSVPIDLFSFTYSLYGGGRFWADGTEKNPCSIPAFESVEKELFLVMNFIDMRRDLLDQVIAMKRVRYRFTGTADIGTTLYYLPAYTKSFDLQGDSVVER